MKPLIVTFPLSLMFFFSCGSGHPDKRVTAENAFEGVNKYCHDVYDWSAANENPSIMNVEMGQNRILRMKWYSVVILEQRFIFMLTRKQVTQGLWRKYRI